MAIDEVQFNSDAQKIMGIPIKPGFWTMGEVSVEEGGKADLVIPVQGSKKKGMVYVNTIKEKNRWKFEKLVLIPEGGLDLDLLKVSQPTSVPVQQPPQVGPSTDTPPSKDKKAVQPGPTSAVATLATPVQKPLQQPVQKTVTEKKTTVAKSDPSIKKQQAVTKTKKMDAKRIVLSGDVSTASGRVEINAGDYKGAIKTLTTVIANNPDESINFRLRGNAYDNLGNRERAIEDWKKAAALGDDLIQSYLNFLGIDWK